MNNNTIIECRQHNASSVYNNGDYESKIKPIAIYEGDEITINKCFIDVESQDDQKTNIEQDITIRMDCFVYNYNWFIGSSGGTDDMTFDNAGYKNDGYEYFLTSSTPLHEPVSKGYKLYTQMQLIPTQNTADGDYYGNNATLSLNYIDNDGKVATAYITATSTQYYAGDADQDRITITISIYAKVGGMAGKGGISTMENSFSVPDPSDWTNNHCDPKYPTTTASGTAQHNIIQPRIFTKEIKLKEGRYNPNDLTTILNNELTLNTVISEQSFNQDTIINSAFLKESKDNKLTQETFNIQINELVVYENETHIDLKYQQTHEYVPLQSITLSNLPNATFKGIPLNGLNATINAVSTSQTPETLEGGVIRINQGTNASSDGALRLNEPIFSIVLVNGSNKATVNYKCNNDPEFSNGDTIKIHTPQTGTHEAINFSTEINGSRVIESVSAYDATNKTGNFKIPLPRNATGDFTDVQNNGTIPNGNAYVIRNPTLGDGTGAKITTTETTSDYRYLSRFDGKRLKQYSKTFNSNTQDGNYWIGASQMEIVFDTATDKYKLNYNHSPIYNAANEEAILIAKDAQTVPALSSPYYYANRDGGVIFHALSATADADGSDYDFWKRKLGFDPKKICMDYEMKVLTLGGGNNHVGVFNKPVLGVNITGQRPDLDSLIVKGTTFYNVPSIDSYPATSQNLTIEIYADEVILDQDAYKFGYYYIEVQAGLNSEVSGEVSPSDGGGYDVRKNLLGIIGNYYSLGGFTSSEGSNIIYRHVGSPMYINNIKIRILKSNKQLDESLGDDNTIFFQVSRGEIAMALDNIENKK